MTLAPTLTDEDIASLERATLDAVAPPAVEAIGHWLAPFDASTIGRAKSAVPLRHHGMDAAELRGVEARYHQHGLPAAFRVADVPGLAPIHDAMRAMGYAPTQPTLVQVGTISALLALPCDTAAPIDTRPSPRWSAVYTATGFDPVDGNHRVQALSRSPHVVYASVHQAGQPLAAGTAAFSQGWASIHGMRTVPSHRGQGLAGQILLGLAREAAARQLERVFLQVEEDNAAAQALYRRAGFDTHWRYHYWRKPA